MKTSKINLIYGRSGSGKESICQALYKQYPNLIHWSGVPATEKWRNNAVFIAEINEKFLDKWLEKIGEWSIEYCCQIFIETCNKDLAKILIDKLQENYEPLK
jgi:adenylate kinase family enzyme